LSTPGRTRRWKRWWESGCVAGLHGSNSGELYGRAAGWPADGEFQGVQNISMKVGDLFERGEDGAARSSGGSDREARGS
jgi:hypothetical protein